MKKIKTKRTYHMENFHNYNDLIFEAKKYNIYSTKNGIDNSHFHCYGCSIKKEIIIYLQNVFILKVENDMGLVFYKKNRNISNYILKNIEEKLIKYIN